MRTGAIYPAWRAKLFFEGGGKRQAESRLEDCAITTPEMGLDSAVASGWRRNAGNLAARTAKIAVFGRKIHSPAKKLFIFAQFSRILTCVPILSWLYSGAARVFPFKNG